MKIYDVTLIYKNGSVITLKDLIKFNIVLGERSEAKWKFAPWANTRVLIMNVGEIQACYSTVRRVYNPFKMFTIWKLKNED